MNAGAPLAPIEVLRDRYDRERWIRLRGLLPPDMVDFVVTYANILGATGRVQPDVAVGQSLSRYGAPGFDALLVHLLPTVSEIAGSDLTPTYSYARVYFRGDELTRHRDRPACEHSVTLHLDSSGGSWPVHFQSVGGEDVTLDLAPGDGVLYRGIELPHWRQACPADWYLQVFLHWVESEGANRDHALDGRAHLGLPSVRGQAR